MRILFCDFNLPALLADDRHPIGGATVQLKAWISGLLSEGCDVAVLVGEDAPRSNTSDLPFKLIPVFDPGHGVRKLRTFYYRYPRVVRAIRGFAPDLVMHHLAGTLTGVLAVAARRAGVPFAVRISNDPWADDRYRQLLTRHASVFYGHGLRRANLIVCQNGYQEKSLAEAWPGKRIVVIPNPFLAEEAPGARAASQRSYVAWLGTFEEQKNLPLLLTIARQLQDVHFKIAGARGRGAASEIDDTVEQLRSRSNVELVGYLRRSEVANFLGRAHALLNTSKYEGFSNTFLEALAVGTPIVAQRHVDPSGFIEAHDLGAVCSTEGELADAVHSIATAPYDNSRGRRCVEHVSSAHAPPAIARQLMNSIQSGRR